jgi:acetyltransferase-like isoleucine patch superfamily enzyme
MNKEFSLIFRFLKKLGLNFSEEEYGNVSFFSVLKKTYRRYRNSFLIKYCTSSILFSPVNARLVRPKIWRKVGCEVGKGVFIGMDCSIDLSNSSLIKIEDGVHIAARSIILCHQRDISNYYVGYEYSKLPYIRKHVCLKKGCLIGTQSIVMPGVTVGEGAIVGAYSLVTKDVPPWTIAVGVPAKVVKKVPNKDDLN